MSKKVNDFIRDLESVFGSHGDWPDVKIKMWTEELDRFAPEQLKMLIRDVAKESKIFPSFSMVVSVINKYGYSPERQKPQDEKYEGFNDAMERAISWLDNYYHKLYSFETERKKATLNEIWKKTALRRLMEDFKKEYREKYDFSEKNTMYVFAMMFKLDWLPERFYPMLEEIVAAKIKREEEDGVSRVPDFKTLRKAMFKTLTTAEG